MSVKAYSVTNVRGVACHTQHQGLHNPVGLFKLSRRVLSVNLGLTSLSLVPLHNEVHGFSVWTPIDSRRAARNFLNDSLIRDALHVTL